MRYTRKKIEELDAMQAEYIKYHTEQYGTQNLVINGETYYQRCEKCKPSEEEIKKSLRKGYEAYLFCNLRGWQIVYKTECNKKMYNWNNLEKLQ